MSDGFNDMKKFNVEDLPIGVQTKVMADLKIGNRRDIFIGQILNLRVCSINEYRIKKGQFPLEVNTIVDEFIGISAVINNWSNEAHKIVLSEDNKKRGVRK